MYNKFLLIFISSFLPAICLAGGNAMPPAMVKTASAQMIKIAPTVVIAGTVISPNDTQISAEVDSDILYIRDVGEEVEEGGILAELESDFYQLKLQELQATLLPLQARYQFYENEKKRLQNLIDNDFAPQDAFEQALSSYHDLAGQIKLASVRIKLAELDLERTKILAPFSGIVVERFESKGGYTKIGEPLLRLVSNTRFEIQARVSAEVVPFLTVGSSIPVSNGVHKSQCRLQAVVPISDMRSHLHELRLSSCDYNWRIGNAVTLSVPIDSPREVLAIPRDALVIRANTINIYKVNEQGIAELAVVKTGIGYKDIVEVIGDIQLGDKVVIRGNERLRPGQPVKAQEH